MNSEKKYIDLKRKFKKIKKKCEVCYSSNNVVFQNYGRISVPLKYGILKISICKDCGHKFQNPVFPDTFYKQYYKLLYRTIAFDGIEPSKKYLNEQKDRGERVHEWFKNNTNYKVGTMLDHGCASGMTMISWMKNGWDSIGIDPHGPSVKLGKKLGMNIKVAAGEKLPFENDRFNLVLSLGSLEHSYNINKSLSEICRVLKRGGQLYVRWRSNKIFGSPLEYFNHNHYRFFSLDIWRILLSKYNLKIIKFSEKKIEGWDSYNYFIAEKLISSESRKYFVKMKKIHSVDYLNEIKNLSQLRINYYENCIKILNFYNSNTPKDDEFIKYIRSLKSKTFCGFLGGKKSSIVKRSLMEAKKYIKEFESGIVN